MRVSLVEQLKSGSRTETGGGKSHRLRNIFATAQIALAVALVIGSALMCKGMWSTLQFANVYRPKQVLTFHVTLPSARYGDAVKQAAWYKASLEKLEALPGVKQAAATTMLPYGEGGWVDDFRIENRPLPPGKFDSAVRVRLVRGLLCGVSHRDCGRAQLQRQRRADDRSGGGGEPEVCGAVFSRREPAGASYPDERGARQP